MKILMIECIVGQTGLQSWFQAFVNNKSNLYRDTIRLVAEDRKRKEMYENTRVA